MPPLDRQIFDRLQAVTSSLPLLFSLGFQSSNMQDSPGSREFYQLMLAALSANTIARIMALDSEFAHARGAVAQSMDAAEVVNKSE